MILRALRTVEAPEEEGGALPPKSRASHKALCGGYRSGGQPDGGQNREPDTMDVEGGAGADQRQKREKAVTFASHGISRGAGTPDHSTAGGGERPERPKGSGSGSGSSQPVSGSSSQVAWPLHGHRGPT